jgi:hypothetical protein
MWHVWGRREIQIKLYSGKLEGNRPLERTLM